MLIYAVVVFPVLMFFMALAVDFGHMALAKSELQSAVDAATRAAANGLSTSPAQARANAKAVALMNTIDGVGLVLTDADIVLGTFNETTGTFSTLSGANESNADSVLITGQLSAARNSAIKLALLPIVSPGNAAANMSKQAIVIARKTGADYVIVQDVSGSFSSEIDSARIGDRDFLDSLNVPGSKSNFGLVAFTGTASQIASIKGVAANYVSLRNAVNTLDTGTSGMPSTISGTDIAAGIEKAQSMFNAFAASSTNTSKCMIIVSDGEPTMSWFNAHPFKSDTQLLAIAQADADTAYASGIDINVVFWDDANSATSAANLKSLVRGKGVFVHVTDPSKISSSISTVVARSQSLVK